MNPVQSKSTNNDVVTVTNGDRRVVRILTVDRVVATLAAQCGRINSDFQEDVVDITMNDRIVTDQNVVAKVAIDRVAVPVTGRIVTDQVRQVIPATAANDVVMAVTCGDCVCTSLVRRCGTEVVTDGGVLVGLAVVAEEDVLSRPTVNDVVLDTTEDDVLSVADGDRVSITNGWGCACNDTLRDADAVDGSDSTRPVFFGSRNGNGFEFNLAVVTKDQVVTEHVSDLVTAFTPDDEVIALFTVYRVGGAISGGLDGRDQVKGLGFRVLIQEVESAVVAQAEVVADARMEMVGSTATDQDVGAFMPVKHVAAAKAQEVDRWCGVISYVELATVDLVELSIRQSANEDVVSENDVVAGVAA